MLGDTPVRQEGRRNIKRATDSGEVETLKGGRALAIMEAVDTVAISQGAGRLCSGGQLLQAGHGSLQTLHQTLHSGKNLGEGRESSL